MKMKNGVLLLAVAGALAGPLAAQAADVRYDFTVNGEGQGPLGNQTSSGSFSYDTSIIPVGGGLVAGMGLLTGLSFTWGGLSYGLTPASTGALEFDTSGNLDGVNIGNACNAFGACTFDPNAPGWLISGFTPEGPFKFAEFDYTVGDGNVYIGGQATLTRVEVPTPTPVWLMAGCLIGLAAAIRKSRSLKPVGFLAG